MTVTYHDNPQTLRFRPAARALRGFFRAGRRSAIAFRGDFFFGVVTLAVQLAVAVTVWRTVFNGREQVGGASISVTVTYAALAACLQSVLMPWQFSSLPMRVRRGQIATDMTRPMSLIGQVSAQNAGVIIGRLPIGLAGVVVTALLGALTAPASPLAAVYFVISATLGAAISLMASLAVSMATFWTLEVGGPMMLYRMGAAFLSGALIPLWFMPDWMASALAWLPFQAQVYTPLSIYLGRMHGARVGASLAVQAVWIVIMYAVLQLIWRRAQHKVVVQGG